MKYSITTDDTLFNDWYKRYTPAVVLRRRDSYDCITEYHKVRNQFSRLLRLNAFCTLDGCPCVFLGYSTANALVFFRVSSFIEVVSDIGMRDVCLYPVKYPIIKPLKIK